METCPFQHFTFIHISLLFVFSLFSFTGCKIPLSETQLFADIFRIHHYTKGFISSKRETISCHAVPRWFFSTGRKKKKKINHKRKMLLDFHDLMLCFSSFACFFFLSFSPFFSSKSSRNMNQMAKKKHTKARRKEKALRNSIKVMMKMSSLLRCVTWVCWRQFNNNSLDVFFLFFSSSLLSFSIIDKTFRQRNYSFEESTMEKKPLANNRVFLFNLFEWNQNYTRLKIGRKKYAFCKKKKKRFRRNYGIWNDLAFVAWKMRKWKWYFLQWNFLRLSNFHSEWNVDSRQ